MKDEFGGVIVIEFVGLKSKMYSIEEIDGKEYNTAEAVNVATEFDKFKDALFDEKIIRHKMKRIQSQKHKLGIYEIDKISLSCFDNKLYVLGDGIRMLAYFCKNSVSSSPLSPTNLQIYKKWPSPVFCFSKSMVYWGYKINKTKKSFCQIFILWILEVCDVTEVKKDPKTHEN